MRCWTVSITAWIKPRHSTRPNRLKNVSLAGLSIVPGSAIPSGALISPSGIQPDAYTPTILSYTLKIEQQIAPNTSLSVGYVGSHGYHEMLSLDANEPFPAICPALPCPAALGARHDLLPEERPARESQPGEYNFLVLGRSQLLQCP